MTMEEAPGPAPRLSFGTTFSAGFATVFGQLGTFLKASLLPFALSLALGLVAILISLSLLADVGAGASAIGDSGEGVGSSSGLAYGLLDTLLQILGLLPFIIFAIACNRLALLGRQAGAVPRPLIGRRTMIYLGYSLLMLLILALPTIAFAIYMRGDAMPFLVGDAAAPDVQSPASVGLLVLGFFLFYLVYLYFLLRLSLVFPAASVDQKLGLGGSWRLTRGVNGFKLYAAFLLLLLALVVLTIVLTAIWGAIVGLFWLGPDAFPQDPSEIDATLLVASQGPTLVLSLVLEYLGSAVMIVALASAFAQLTGWGAPRADILERFE